MELYFPITQFPALRWRGDRLLLEYSDRRGSYAGLCLEFAAVLELRSLLLASLRSDWRGACGCYWQLAPAGEGRALDATYMDHGIITADWTLSIDLREQLIAQLDLLLASDTNRPLPGERSSTSLSPAARSRQRRERQPK